MSLTIRWISVRLRSVDHPAALLCVLLPCRHSAVSRYSVEQVRQAESSTSSARHPRHAPRWDQKQRASAIRFVRTPQVQHTRLLRRAVIIATVTGLAGLENIRPDVWASPSNRDDVSSAKCASAVLSATVHAQVTISLEQCAVGQRRRSPVSLRRTGLLASNAPILLSNRLLLNAC